MLVTLWPVLESLPDFGDFEIEVDRTRKSRRTRSTEQLDALRNQFAELEDHDGELSDRETSR